MPQRGSHHPRNIDDVAAADGCSECVRPRVRFAVCKTCALPSARQQPLAAAQRCLPSCPRMRFFSRAWESGSRGTGARGTDARAGGDRGAGPLGGIPGEPAHAAGEPTHAPRRRAPVPRASLRPGGRVQAGVRRFPRGCRARAPSGLASAIAVRRFPGGGGAQARELAHTPGGTRARSGGSPGTPAGEPAHAPQGTDARARGAPAHAAGNRRTLRREKPLRGGSMRGQPSGIRSMKE